MRGTSKITNNNSLYFINKNFNNLMKVSNQIALEQQVVNLEDDPLSANVGIKMLNVIAKSEQYNRNIKTGIASLALTDGYLSSSKSLMDKVKTLTTGAANDPSATSATRSANAIELNELLRQLVTSGNANDGSRYIFGGQNTTKPPFTIVNGRYVNYTGNDKDVNAKVDNGTSVAINCTGSSAYGNMITKIPSRDMNPDVSLSTDRSTALSDLNGGDGVPKGKIKVYYSSYPEGLEVDLSACDTLEDVKDVIEKATLQASRDLDPTKHSWIDNSNLDWHDLQDRYVKVTVNPEHNGISLQEFDKGEPLPEPTPQEIKRGKDYSGKPGYPAGGGGLGVAVTEKVETTVHDKLDTIYQTKPNSYYPPLRVEDFANNKVAESLGIKGTAGKYNPGSPDRVKDGFIHGRDLNPRLSDKTLLADLEGYNDSVYSFTNGAKPDSIVIQETSQDPNNRFSEWRLAGLNKGSNTGPNGELYVRATNRGTPANPEIYVEVFSCPVDKAKASDRVATGVLKNGTSGGTVVLSEDNDSGLSGTVGVILPSTVSEATISLKVDFGETLQSSVHVPAFIEEKDPNGHSLDIFDIASGWNIRGLDKPPADGYDRNHPASTDLDGDVSVNYRLETDPVNGSYFVVELCRPSFNDQPASIIASGKIYLGDNNGPPLDTAVSGRVEFIGAPGFEGVKGSVFIELPAGADFAAAQVGVDADNPTTNTYQLQSNSPAGTIVLGGAMELAADQNITSGYFQLKDDTTFKKGQVFDQDVHLRNGKVIYAGTPIDTDMVLPKGTYVSATTLKEGTILAEGQEVDFTSPIAAGTVIPRGSYYSDGSGNGFPQETLAVTKTDAMTGAVTTTSATPAGHDLRATFATVEDFNRAVEEAGIYVTSKVSDDGKSLEFQSTLAGAYLTVSEDTDCYEQMGDVHQQLTGLDLNGMVKGVNTDKNGNVYTEVIYYPPNEPPNEDQPVQLVSEDGKIIEVQPGYYVRVYSDPDEMKKKYEDRDNTKMVAEGFVPAGKWNPDWWDPNITTNLPFVPGNPPATLGTFENLVLEERNGSGVWGTVNLDYYGTRDQFVTDADGKVDYNPWSNDQITVYPGGLRPEGSRHTTIQEWDMNQVVPGVTCDYAGTFHGEITGNGVTPDEPAIRLYKDSTHSVMTSRSALPGEMVNGVPLPYSENGKVVLYEVDRYGNIALDANGEAIVAGNMAIARNELPADYTDNFTLTTGATRHYGQEREENVFSTINDIIDALNQNDAGKLHDLLGSIQKDIDHILEASGDVGARTKRLEMLSERHADDIVRFTGTLTSRVGMDDQALAMSVLKYQAATNAYQAAMQVSAQVMQMSLLQFL